MKYFYNIDDEVVYGKIEDSNVVPELVYDTFEEMKQALIRDLRCRMEWHRDLLSQAENISNSAKGRLYVVKDYREEK